MIIFAEKGQRMEQLAKFVSEHINDDTSRLLLARGKWPDIDMDLAVNCIESRRKLKGKVQEWYDNPELIFPARLSAEQCSSSATGHYKTELICHIAQESSVDRWRIADLTGGFGVDSWHFSMKAEKVLYNEMQTCLCDAARHNFHVLGADNIEISNNAVGNGPGEMSPSCLLKDFASDIVYMDPARRGEGGKKVFLIEECTPDVLTLKDEIFSIARHIVIKLSPMADISMVCDRLGATCREVHVTATGGECKELLIWMDREWNGAYSVHAAELPKDYPQSRPSVFSFTPSEEKIAGQAGNDIPSYPTPGLSYPTPGLSYPTPGLSYPAPTGYLFEPGKALMKSGAFNLISSRFSLAKLGRSTHYYTFRDPSIIQRLNGIGKVYEIIRCESLDKRTLKAAGKDFPKAEVTARNIPMDTDTLRKKMGVTSGDDAHIFGLKSDQYGNLLLCTKRVL